MSDSHTDSKGCRRGINQMRAEYSRYVFEAADIALNSSSREAVLEQLVFIRTELVGFGEDAEHGNTFARTMFSLVRSDSYFPKANI